MISQGLFTFRAFKISKRLMETHGQARIAWALVPGKWVLALVQGVVGPVGTKHPTTETLAEVALGSNFPYFHDAISAVLRVLEHGISSGIITFAQFDGERDGVWEV